MKRLLLCCGDANDPLTHGGLSFSLLQAGLRKDFLHGGISLYPERLIIRKILWNFIQYFRFGKPGGFQYSKTFAKFLLAQANLPVDESINILSHFPLLPAWPWSESWQVDFYIDATTFQIFKYYGIGKKISGAFQKKVLEREQIAYQNASQVICRSQWAADSLMLDYEISPKKISVIPGGANIQNYQLQNFYSNYQVSPPSIDNPLRLGLIGQDWKRKGGPFLLELIQALRHYEIPAVIRCIGPNDSMLLNNSDVNALGFINKNLESRRFIDEVKTWHFGTLFSSAEAFGISNRECLRLGVPVIAHAVGGIPSTFSDETFGKLFNPYPDAFEVANWIHQKINPFSSYLKWRDSIATSWYEFTWDASVDSLKQLFGESPILLEK